MTSARPPAFQIGEEGAAPPRRACFSFASLISSACAASNSCWLARPTERVGITSKVSPAVSVPSMASTSSF